MMTNIELLEKRRNLKRKKAIRQAICNAVVATTLIVVVAIGVNAFLNSWTNQIEAQGEYNRQYIQQAEMERAKNFR